MLNVFRRRDVESPVRRARRQSDDAIRIVALTRDAEEWQCLHAIAREQEWVLLWAHSSARAREIIARYRVPIVICDRDLPNEDWRSVLLNLANMRPAVCPLLASEVADEYLWREVVQNRGFEIITKPFVPEKVVRTVRFAANWRGLVAEGNG